MKNQNILEQIVDENEEMLWDNNWLVKHSPGDEISFRSRVWTNAFLSKETPVIDISKLLQIPLDELKEMQNVSIEAEKEIVCTILDSITAWRRQAKRTMLLNMATKYLQTPAVKHSNNEWVYNESYAEISNMVYKMVYRLYKSSEQFMLSWDFYFNSPIHSIVKIRGQRNNFKSESEMQKYLDGRIKHHSDYFTELSPPVPTGSSHYFAVNGQLLPGYRIE